MRFTSAAVAAAALLSGSTTVSAFAPPSARSAAAFAPSSSSSRSGAFVATTKLSATLEDEKTEEKKGDKVKGDDGIPEVQLDAAAAAVNADPDAEGLPWWWELVWDLDVMRRGEPGTDCIFGDSAHVLRTNIEQIYGGYTSLDGCPLAEGEITDIADGTMFIGLQRYQNKYGSPYKLCFGPKSFLVISDPVQAKHVLSTANVDYDKGLLAEILKPIMGKGLIPADPETWSVRRRQIVPAFHKAWLEHMVGLFGYCNRPLIDSLTKISEGNGKVEMEEKFCSVALDIIGKSVFNYEFGSVTSESPVIKAVYSALVEAEHRSMTPAPYWDLPLANQVVPRLRKFNSDLKLLNDVLDELIDRAKSTRQVEDIEELESRNYAEVKDPSLLRFLVDLRGADIDNKQLRDDLMTMLIAGHETTAAVLTWALFELSKNPEISAKVRAEIDSVVGDREPTLEDVKDMRYLRLVIAETLRLYPEPPLLIRRCRTENDLPKGGGREATVIRGMDMFLSLYNIHRDPKLWPNPDKFDPDRFDRPYVNPEVEGWAGYDPKKWEGRLYPNEISADFAYLPFGGGARKCVGDDFALLEASVTLATVLRRFEFEFDEDFKTEVDINEHPQNLDHPVGMRTGATIHTRKGLHMIVKKREL
uniref:Cytochrome P450 n=1 Tax=Trieres chinensis TaxID=1514140 RepID=A0A7S2ECU8_TRICV|eukprot:CAMPEP_0183303660 /NCGR_PEP_ID=MMETSP0160_2-20130417/9011_1 /TAXON_ID=2839 ORGANISM="Odontella Sinensis, Strain Grunow 1884" /NCGR_SAMPLE_ID=MMETSP0160_2 /ASSEMBLY_ACC=CAM_ASM_000250 /LENGTH=643 /DNA_ID=CAMNT_0025466591 /DNA_START=72 /DNA_END=2003 /DNA_ORIENTATION=+